MENSLSMSVEIKYYLMECVLSAEISQRAILNRIYREKMSYMQKKEVENCLE